MAFLSLRTRTKNKNKNDGKKQKKGSRRRRCVLCVVFLYSCIAVFKLAVSLSAVSRLSVCSVS